MAAKAVKLYPIIGRFLMDVPRAVVVVATKGEADDLIASGAYTDNPNHPERDPDVPDLTGGKSPGEAEPIETRAPETPGLLDSQAEE